MPCRSQIELETNTSSRQVHRMSSSNVSRLEAGETLVERTRFDFADMTRTTVDQMRLLAEEKNLRLRFESTKPVDIEGDPLRLKQIVVNLVDNAIKYTPSGGSVSVSTFPQDGRVVLEVADT